MAVDRVKISFVQHPGSATLPESTQGFWNSLWKCRGCLGSESSQHERGEGLGLGQVPKQEYDIVRVQMVFCSLLCHLLLPSHQNYGHQVRPRIWKSFCKLQKSQESLPNPSTGSQRPWKDSIPQLIWMSCKGAQEIVIIPKPTTSSAP
jgi:hypothetical protein